MSEKIGEEFAIGLLDINAFGVGVVIIIWHLPVGEMVGCDGKRERTGAKPLHVAELNVERKIIVLLIEAFYLAAGIFNHSGKR